MTSSELSRGLAGLRAWAFAGTAGILIALLIGVQVLRDRHFPLNPVERSVLYVRSGPVLERVALSYDALLADVYWIRAIQHFGSTRLTAAAADKRYDLLYPLLDLTTTLDPRFNIAYRFGAIFLAEAYPDGPGRPDQAVALLKKAIQRMPTQWQYPHDVGFIFYWWLNDYVAAAEWFRRAGRLPGAPRWLESLAAATLAQGGHRAASRLLWQQIYVSADEEWLRRTARHRLAQLEAMDQIDRLETAVRRFTEQAGRAPGSWRELVRAGHLPGAPVDPAGTLYRLDPQTGRITVDRQSPLFPLPTEPPSVAAPRS